MTEAAARVLLRDSGGFSGLEAWMVRRRWQAVPVPHGLRRTTGSGLVGLPELAGTVMTLDGPHVLALGAGALMLVCVSFLGSLNSVVMWTLRLIAWAMIATVILVAP